MKDLTLKACRVTIFKNGSVQVSFSFAESIRNEDFSIKWLVANFELKFQGSRSRKAVPQFGRAVESSVTLGFKRDRVLAKLFSGKAPFRLCARKTENEIEIGAYEVNDLRKEKEPSPDDSKPPF